MPVTRLLREQTIGEIRWVALDERDDPVALYLERPHDAARRAVIGARLEARVTRVEASMGGAFVDLGARGDGFLRLKPDETLAEGARIPVVVVAEARRNKAPRLRKAPEGPDGVSGAALWLATLKGGATAAREDRAAGDAEIQAAFEGALAPGAVLKGGGRLQMERTEALVAADIDTAGRKDRGSRAAGAIAINSAAAEALAREIHVRGWGGLAVLDCVAPVDKAAGAQVRSAFLDTFRGISNRAVKALPPSAFGLMEISSDWQLTPLSERLNGEGSAATPETLALEGLRRLEAQARAARMGRLRLTLPPPAHDWLAKSGLDAPGQLAQTYGGRLSIVSGPIGQPDVEAIA